VNNKIVFIPIKEHSARVAGKNFRDFCGYPLYLYVLNKYDGIDVDVFVNTDSEEIEDTITKTKLYGKFNNINVIRRKTALCGDDVSVNLLIIDFLKEMKDHFSERKDIWIAQTHVTTPFLKTETVLFALRLMESQGIIQGESLSSKSIGYDSAASVNLHQSRFWRFDEYGYSPVNHNPMKLEKTQDLPVFYEENSCFYIFNPYNFSKFGGYRVGKLPYFFEISFPENVDIDTEDDWKMCDILSKLGVNK